MCIRDSDYAELERKRSVLEVTTALQNHPYFADSLKGLSPMNLHRAQIEEALRKDIFYKYESLMHYTYKKGSFGTYFLMRCEITELLAKIRLLSMGFRHHYICLLYTSGKGLQPGADRLQNGAHAAGLLCFL